MSAAISIIGIILCILAMVNLEGAILGYSLALIWSIAFVVYVMDVGGAFENKDKNK